MKKFYLIFALLSLISLTMTAQPQLTWRFNNVGVINAGTQLQFDVEVKASVAGSYQRDLQIYFDYSTLGFGSNIVAGGKITYTPLTLMDATKYVVVNMADNTTSKFAIITEASNEMTQPGSATYYREVTTTYQGLLRFTINIATGGNTQTAGIAFDQALMNGGQYYQSTTNTDPIKYIDPSLYENNLSTFKLSSLYGTITYNNISNTVLNGCTVTLYQSGVPISVVTSSALGLYNFSGVADGSYTIQTTCPKAFGGIQAFDATMIQKFAGGAISLTDLQKRAGDVNQSGGSGPNAFDATQIKKFLATGLKPTVWTAPNYVFEAPFLPVGGGTPVTVVNGLALKNYKSLCSGDLNGNFTPVAE